MVWLQDNYVGQNEKTGKTLLQEYVQYVRDLISMGFEDAIYVMLNFAADGIPDYPEHPRVVTIMVPNGWLIDVESLLHSTRKLN